MIRAAALLGVVLLTITAPLAAQEPTRPSRAESVRERALEKLRALERAGRPVADSTVADDLEADRSATPGSAVGDTVAAASPTAGVAGRTGAESDSTRAADAPADAPPRAALDDAAVPGADVKAALTTAANGPPGLLPGAPVIVHMPPDSLVAALRNLEGYTLTEYTAADGASFAADSGRLELIGNPSLRRKGQSMRSDSLLVYTEPTSIVCGYGKPVLESTEGDPVESDQVCYNVERRIGVAVGARTQFSQNGTWFVHGHELYTSGDDRVYGADAEFTSCDLDEPHYHFAAKSVKIVHDEILVARDVTLRFRDVPVFWLPFMVQSMKKGRRSGLLTPDFSLTDVVRTSSGLRREITNLGYYWAINDYMDAQVAFGWRSGDWSSLNGQFRYKWDRQFLNGGVNFTQFWREGGREFTLSTNNSWRPGENTSITASGTFVSSTRFIEQNTYDPDYFNRSIQSRAGLNHRFDWGTLNISASRNQYLTEDKVVMQLPSASLSFLPVTLFPAAGSSARWYNNATWNGNLRFDSQITDADEMRPGAGNRDSRRRSGSISSSFNLGNFSWSQSASFDESIQEMKAWMPDTAVAGGEVTIPALPRTAERRINWNTSIGYSQRLIGTSTLSPSISLGGQILDSDTTGGQMVAGPTRINFGASLNTKLYGFWPGFGPFSRLRHAIDPRLTYTYSPVPEVTDLQRRIFGEQAGRETNQLQIHISQTFEAKYKDEGGAEVETDTTAAGRPGEPRRMQQARKIKLLSVSTSALVYDFARAKRGDYGLQTAQLTHSVTSDLLGGLSFTLAHDLFDDTRDSEGKVVDRSFAPSIRSLDTSFTLDNNSWLFRVLGLGRKTEAPADTAAADSAMAGADIDVPHSSGFLGPKRPPTAFGSSTGAVGTWRADIQYRLNRPRDASTEHSIIGGISFQPTENWSVSWRTGLSNRMGDWEFSDHYLTFTRDLHRWQANFAFVKALNGNLMFNFRVHLLDNPDIQLEHDERYETLAPPPPPGS